MRTHNTRSMSRIQRILSRSRHSKARIKSCKGKGGMFLFSADANKNPFCTVRSGFVHFQREFRSSKTVRCKCSTNSQNHSNVVALPSAVNTRGPRIAFYLALKTHLNHRGCWCGAPFLRGYCYTIHSRLLATVVLFIRGYGAPFI